MNSFIAFVDVLGTKNSSEKEDFEDYLRLVTNFQNELLRIVPSISNVNGRIHFFSDCAYIETTSLKVLIESLSELRRNLFDSDIFIRGAITHGILGAINDVNSSNYIKTVYQDSIIMSHFESMKDNLEKYQNNIKGTIFCSRDLAKAAYYESIIKGSAIFIEESLKSISDKNIHDLIVQSGYISNITTKKFEIFYDIKYDNSDLTDAFFKKVFRNYYTSNLYDLNYGRYYLTIIISCINSCDFSKVNYIDDKKEFINRPPILIKILNLRKEFKELYDFTKGLEFIYLTLINKFYSDIGINSLTTKVFLIEMLKNKKYLDFYQNRLSKIPKEILTNKVKTLLINDLRKLAEDK